MNSKTITNIAPALRGGAMPISGIAPALRGGAMPISGIAPALRGGAMRVVASAAVLVFALRVSAQPAQQAPVQPPAIAPTPAPLESVPALAPAAAPPAIAPVSAEPAPAADATKNPAATEQPAAEPGAAQPATAEQPAGGPEGAPAAGASLGAAIEAPANTATLSPATAPHPQDAGESEPNAEEEKSSVPWVLSLGWSHGYYAKGLGVNSYQTFNPEYYWGFLLTAGWKFSKATALTFNEYATIELTDSDSTVHGQQFIFFNPTLDVSHKLSFETRASEGLDLKGALGVILPTSSATSSTTFIVGTNSFGARGRIAATYTWKKVFNGLELSPGFGYQRRFNTSNTLGAENTFPCDTLSGSAGGSLSHDCRYLGSMSTTRDVFALGIDANAMLGEKFVAGLSLTNYWSRGRDLALVNYTPESGGNYPIPDASVTHWRNLRWFAFSLGYKLTSWFTLSGNVRNVFGERGPRSELRAPFHWLDTVFGLDLDISFDELYLSMHSHGAAAH